MFVCSLGQLRGGQLSSTCGFWGLNSGRETQWQMPLPAESAHQPQPNFSQSSFPSFKFHYTLLVPRAGDQVSAQEPLGNSQDPYHSSSLFPLYPFPAQLLSVGWAPTPVSMARFHLMWLYFL